MTTPQLGLTGAFCKLCAALFLFAAGVSAHPPTTPIPPPTTLSADVTSYILTGRVVTMDEAFAVIDPGYVWIDKGVIVAVADSIEKLGVAERNNVPVIATNGDIFPGLIDLHNHPEYAIYPLLPITRKYKDRYEWRFYDDDYARRITHLNTLMVQPHYFALALEVGRYGEYKALVGGTTSLQGGRGNLAYAKEECLVRNIETSLVTPRPAFSRVDIGRDAEEWRRMAEESTRGPMAIHLAEGVGPRMANEFEALKRSGLLGPGLIAIHGVGLTEAQFKEMAAVKAHLVWSPLSNFMLYGQTADVRAARRAGVMMSLAPDWAPSGSKSLLGELKVADLVNKHALGGLISDRELVAMATVNPAAAMGWQGRLGRIVAGHLADVLVVARVDTDPYRNLIHAVEAQIRLVVVRGEALYGDRAVVSQLRVASALETLPDMAGAKVIAPNCPHSALPTMRVADTVAKLQQGLNLDNADVARRVSKDQFSRDFALCNIGQPKDPPEADDAGKLLACRFQLPFEKTRLSPLTTAADGDFFPRLMANPNLPSYLRALPEYYRPR